MGEALVRGSIQALLQGAQHGFPVRRGGDTEEATGSTYGTCDAGRGWYLYSKEVFKSEGCLESRLEKGFYLLPSPGGAQDPGITKNSIIGVFHTHVDDGLAAQNEASKHVKTVLGALTQKLRLLKQELDFVYCGRHIQISEQFIRVDQAKSSVAVDSIQLADGRTRRPDSPLDESETSQYRSVLGQILWLAQQSRLDLCVGVSLLARRTTKATVEDAQTLNRLAKSARDGASHHVCLRRGLLDMTKVTVLCYGDAAFANAEGEKSQYGMITLLTHHPDLVIQGRFDLATLVSWHSGTVKRVVRSTLAAEGYASCESSESVLWLRYLLAEAHNPGMPLKEVESRSSKWPGIVLSDSNSLTTTVNTDVSGSQSTDRRLRIVIAMLREVFTDPLANLGLKWIPTWAQAADPLTKLMLPRVLLAAAESQRFAFAEVVKSAGKRAALLVSRFRGHV